MYHMGTFKYKRLQDTVVNKMHRERMESERRFFEGVWFQFNVKRDSMMPGQLVYEILKIIYIR